jgi:hypothetical protein
MILDELHQTIIATEPDDWIEGEHRLEHGGRARA